MAKNNSSETETAIVDVETSSIGAVNKLREYQRDGVATANSFYLVRDDAGETVNGPDGKPVRHPYPANAVNRVELEDMGGLSGSTIATVIKRLDKANIYELPVAPNSRKKAEFVNLDAFITALEQHINEGGTRNVNGSVDRLFTLTDAELKAVMAVLAGQGATSHIAANPLQGMTRLERAQHNKTAKNGNGATETETAS